MFQEHLFCGFRLDYSSFESYKKSIIKQRGAWKGHTPGHYIPKEYRKPISLNHKIIEHYGFKTVVFYPNGNPNDNNNYTISKDFSANRKFIISAMQKRNELCLGFIDWKHNYPRVDLIRVSEGDLDTVYLVNGVIISVIYNNNPRIDSYFNQFKNCVVLFGFISSLFPERIKNPYIIYPNNTETEPVFTVQTQLFDTKNMVERVVDKFLSSEIYYAYTAFGNDLKEVLKIMITNPCEFFTIKGDELINQGVVSGSFNKKTVTVVEKTEEQLLSLSEKEIKKLDSLAYYFKPGHSFLNSRSMRNKINRINRQIENKELVVNIFYGYKELLSHISEIDEFIAKWVKEYGREDSVTYDAFFTNLVKVLGTNILEKLNIQTILVWDKNKILQGYYISLNTARNTVDTLQGQSLKEIKNLQDWSNWIEIETWREKNPDITFNRGCSPAKDAYIHNYNLKLHPSLITCVSV